MYEAHLTKSLLNKAAFCWSTWQIRVTNLNPLQNLHREKLLPSHKIPDCIDCCWNDWILPSKNCWTMVNENSEEKREKCDCESYWKLRWSAEDGWRLECCVDRWVLWWRKKNWVMVLCIYGDEEGAQQLTLRHPSGYIMWLRHQPFRKL